jgi:hypothetical protein
MKNIGGRNEPPSQPLTDPRWVELLGLKYSQNGGGGITIFQLHEEIVLREILLGLFLVRAQSGIKYALDIGRRGCRCGRLGHSVRSTCGRLTRTEGMRMVFILSYLKTRCGRYCCIDRRQERLGLAGYGI